MAKQNEIDYVLVSDVSDNGNLYYYAGYFTLAQRRFSIPANTQKYTEALKISYKDEAESLCKKINGLKTAFKYHVEEHMYMNKIEISNDEGVKEEEIVKQSVGITTDRSDPDLGHGVDSEPVEQHKKYLVLSEEERAKGYVRPVRDKYIHVGTKIELEDGQIEPLSEEDRNRHERNVPYVAFLRYPESKSPTVGRALTQREVDNIGKYFGGCNGETKMGTAIAETYARNPKFYGSTYCIHCKKHLPVDEFVWSNTNEKVGS